MQLRIYNLLVDRGRKKMLTESMTYSSHITFFFQQKVGVVYCLDALLLEWDKIPDYIYMDSVTLAVTNGTISLIS